MAPFSPRARVNLNTGGGCSNTVGASLPDRRRHPSDRPRRPPSGPKASCTASHLDSASPSRSLSAPVMLRSDEVELAKADTQESGTSSDPLHFDIVLSSFEEEAGDLQGDGASMLRRTRRRTCLARPASYGFGCAICLCFAALGGGAAFGAATVGSYLLLSSGFQDTPSFTSSAIYLGVLLMGLTAGCIGGAAAFCCALRHRPCPLSHPPAARPALPWRRHPCVLVSCLLLLAAAAVCLPPLAVRARLLLVLRPGAYLAWQLALPPFQPPPGYCEAFGAERLLLGGGLAVWQGVRRLAEAEGDGGSGEEAETRQPDPRRASDSAVSESESASGSGSGSESGLAGFDQAHSVASDTDSVLGLAPGGGIDVLAAWRSWGDSAHSVASRLVNNMTREEAGRLVQGVGWRASVLPRGWYVASVLGVPRLGVPSLHVQDAAQGFRTLWPEQAGQVTGWPCLLALGATWDATLAREYGAGVAAEFRAKGANVMLGPSVNVHRVARNGRNAEYLSGEEPSLGAVMTGAYVRGVQSQHVAAVVKHFALNSQETLRDTQDSIADERTLWEVYYPPFQAAVEAGVASVMCAYNKINGTHACGSRSLLLRDLRGRMGFPGWVMSDWWAVHGGAGVAEAGVDQSLPGNDQWFSPDELAARDEDLTGETHGEGEPIMGGNGAAGPGGVLRGRHGLLGGMATRVLAGALQSGALRSRSCAAGCDCGPLLLHAVATSADHRALARRVAGASVVLLKNSAPGSAPAQAAGASGTGAGEAAEGEGEGMPGAGATAEGTGRPALPLLPGACVVLLGAACDAKPIGGVGGASAGADHTPESSAEAGGSDGGDNRTTDDAGGGNADGSGGAGVAGDGVLTGLELPPSDPRAGDWTAGDYYTVGGSGRVLFRRAASVRSGLVSAGVKVLSHYSGQDASEAAAAAAGADVVIACGGAITQEARDRPHLRLDQHDFLTSLAAQTRQARATGAFPPLVTVALAPGAILSDWAEDSDAALILFLGGEATGDAIADVLTGRVNPTARLPVTLPISESDVTPPTAASRVVYTEGVHQAWRGMQGKPVRFPFGHGLSYTSFEYSWGEPPTALLQPTVLRWAAADGARGEGGGGAASSGLASGGTDVAANMSVLIRNSGAVAGAEVVQLYLRFPPAARQPSLVLRSFIKTRLLEPRQSEVVSLALTRRDLSTWAPGAGWDIARGEFVVVVGASSRDGRLVASVVVG